MFLVDAGNPGMKIVRHIDTLDESLYGGHAELLFDGCQVPDDAVLGEVDEGFRYAQVRLGPARMTPWRSFSTWISRLTWWATSTRKWTAPAWRTRWKCASR